MLSEKTALSLLILFLIIALGLGANIFTNWIGRPERLATRTIIFVIAIIAVALTSLQYASDRIDSRSEAEPRGHQSTLTTDGQQTTPLSSPPVATPPPPSPSSPQTQQFLSDLEPVGDSSPDTGSRTVDGTDYAHSIAKRMGGCQKEVAVEYSLSSRWKTFDAVVGIDDKSGDTTEVQFQVYVDKSPVGSDYKATLGSHKRLTIDVSGGIRLKLEAVLVRGDMDLCSNAGNAVWGDARLSG